MRNATPRQSKPGPRFEVLAGTRTVTDCILQATWPKLETNRAMAELILARAIPTARRSGNSGERRKGMKSGWIDFGLVRDFLGEQTNAYRICTKPEAWAERFGNDALVSFK